MLVRVALCLRGGIVMGNTSLLDKYKFCLSHCRHIYNFRKKWKWLNAMVLLNELLEMDCGRAEGRASQGETKVIRGNESC